MSALEQLIAMGFEREKSKKALEAHGFDLERAVNFLIVTNDETVGSEQQQVYNIHYNSTCSVMMTPNSFTYYELQKHSLRVFPPTLEAKQKGAY